MRSRGIPVRPILVAALLLLPGVGLAPPARPQTVYVQMDALEVEDLILHAGNYERQGNWEAALEMYRRLQREHPDGLCPSPDDPSLFVPVDRYCQQRIAAFPPESLGAVRLTLDPRAAVFLERLDRGEPIPLPEIESAAVRFEASRHGARIRDHLAATYWERGRVRQARALWEEAAGDGEISVARARVLSGVARRISGESPALSDAAVGGIRVGGRPLGEDPDARVVEAIPLPTGATATGGETSLDWPRPGGNNAGSGMMPPIEGLQRDMRGGWASPDTGSGPGTAGGDLAPFLPVVVGGSVYISNGREVLRRNLENGRMEARGEGSGVVAGEVASPFGMVSTVASEGRTLALLRTPGSRVTLPSRRGVRTLSHHGYLRMFDLDAAPEEKLLWTFDPANDFPREPRQILSFEGVPLIAGERIYVAGVTDQQWVYLCALTASAVGRGAEARPTLLWKRFLCVDTQPQSEGPIEPVLAERGGTLYVLTNNGALVSLDAETGRRNWVSIYPRPQQQNDANTFGVNPLVVRGGEIFAAPADSDHLLCLDAYTGEMRWSFRRDRADQGGAAHLKYLLGIQGDLLCLAGARVVLISVSRQGMIVGVSMSVGTDGAGSGGMPLTGRPAMTSEAVYCPTAEGIVPVSIELLEDRRGNLQPSMSIGSGNEMTLLRWAEGEEAGVVRPPLRGFRGGNLHVSGPMLLAVGRTQVRAYPLYREDEETFSQIAASGRTPPAKLYLTTTRRFLGRGETRLAVERIREGWRRHREGAEEERITRLLVEGLMTRTAETLAEAETDDPTVRRRALGAGLAAVDEAIGIEGEGTTLDRPWLRAVFLEGLGRREEALAVCLDLQVSTAGRVVRTPRGTVDVGQASTRMIRRLLENGDEGVRVAYAAAIGMRLDAARAADDAAAIGRLLDWHVAPEGDTALRIETARLLASGSPFLAERVLLRGWVAGRLEDREGFADALDDLYRERAGREFDRWRAAGAAPPEGGTALTEGWTANKPPTLFPLPPPVAVDGGGPPPFLLLSDGGWIDTRTGNVRLREGTGDIPVWSATVGLRLIQGGALHRRGLSPLVSRSAWTLDLTPFLHPDGIPPGRVQIPATADLQESGETWAYASDLATHAPVALSAHPQVVSAGRGWVASLAGHAVDLRSVVLQDAVTGRVLWTVPAPGATGLLSLPEGNVAVLHPGPRIRILSGEEGREIAWVNEELSGAGPSSVPPVAVGDGRIAIEERGQVALWDLRGEKPVLLWRSSSLGSPVARLAVGEGRVAVACHGRAIVLDLETGRVVWEHHPEEGLRWRREPPDAVRIAGGRVLVCLPDAVHFPETRGRGGGILALRLHEETIEEQTYPAGSIAWIRGLRPGRGVRDVVPVAGSVFTESGRGWDAGGGGTSLLRIDLATGKLEGEVLSFPEAQIFGILWYDGTLVVDRGWVLVGLVPVENGE